MRTVAFLAVVPTFLGCSNNMKAVPLYNPETEADDTADTGLEPDNDLDGFTISDDCDDNDPNTYPGAAEICDGKDNDCNNKIPKNETDRDGDGVIECEETCPPAPTEGTVGSLADCEFIPSPSGTPFTARIEWSMTHELVDPTLGTVLPAWVWSEYDGYGGIMQAPVVSQATDDNLDGVIDGDDIPDIAVVMGHPDEYWEGVLRLISGDGHIVHASAHWQSFTNANGTHDYAPYHYSGVAMADVDNDGAMEIAVIATRDDDNCYPAFYEVVQTGSAVTLELEQVYGGTNYVCAAHAPAIGDIDADGVIEIIYGKAAFSGIDLTRDWYGDASDSGGRGWYHEYLNTDGYWNSGYHSFPYDLDGDGLLMEVLGGNTVYNSDGTEYCELGHYDGSTWVRATDGYPAVADLLRFTADYEGEPEIVLTGNEYVRVYHGVTSYDPYGENRCLLIAELPNNPADDPDVAGQYPAHPNCDYSAQNFGGQPNISDFDGDGDNEIGVAGACYYSVYHFDEADNNSFKRYAMTETKDWSSASTGSTVFDFNGDGEAEVVFSDEEALYVWGIDSSASLQPWERLYPYLVDNNHKSWTIHEYPLVADVDNDGKAEILVVNSHLPGYEDHFGLYVLGAYDDDWVSARPWWNTHAYHVTNIDDQGDVSYSPPNYSPYTAQDYNSFRQQAPGSFGAMAAPNLYPIAEPPCQWGCGDIYVWVSVGNEGEFVSSSPDIEVTLYGVTSSGKHTLLGSQPVGEYVDPKTHSAGLEFVLSSWDSYDHLLAVVDDPDVFGGDGLAKECDETDNEVEISLDFLCP